MRIDIELPKEWLWFELKDVADIGSGNGAPQDYVYYENGKYPFVRTSDVGLVKQSSNFYNPNDYLNEKAIEEKKLKWWPKKTLLIPKSGQSTFLNHRVLLGEPSYVSSHLATVVAKDNVLPEYLYYWSLMVDAKELTNNVYYPSLTLSELKKAKIPVPPIETQRKIVELLDEIEEIKSLREEANEIPDQLIQSVFFEMFGDPAINSKNWDVKKLSSICNKINDGEHTTPETVEFGIPYISAKNVNHKITFTDCKYITEETYNKLIKRCNPEYNDILMTCVGTIGRVKRIDITDNFLFARSVALLKPNNEIVNTIFLEKMLSFSNMTKLMVGATNTSTVKGLYVKQIKNLDVIVPPLHLQQQFAHIVKMIEQVQSEQSESIEDLNQLFNSILDKAFRGELVC